MIQPRFSKAWFATEEKMLSLVKWTSFTDRGMLEMTQEGLRFHGPEHDFTMSEVNRVELVHQRSPWISTALAGGMLILPFGGLMLATIGRSALPIVAVFTAFVLLVYLLSMLSVHRFPWILVEYRDTQDRSHRAYLCDGSVLGWGGILGGTKDMYHTLKQLCNAK